MSIKEFSELRYWKFKKLFKKHFDNNHYKYFFTDYFSLAEEDYKDKSILDIGCGPRGSLEWADMAKERIGLDPLADKYLKMSGKNHKMNYKKGYIEDLPFEDNYFDIVSSFNSLDHIEDLKKACGEIKRVLKKDGVFLLIVDIHNSPTITEPQTIKWSFLKEYFPGFEIIEEKHLQRVFRNKIYSNLRFDKKLVDLNKDGILVSILIKQSNLKQ